VLIAERAVVGRNSLAVVRVCAGLHLVDEIAHGQRMILRGAEHSVLSLWLICSMNSSRAGLPVP